MSDEPLLHVARVLPQTGKGTFTPEECRAILEVAMMAVDADDVLTEEEAVALREVGQALTDLASGSVLESGAVATDVELAKMHGALRRQWKDSSRKERLGTISKSLARPVARESAYKLALAIGMCDFMADEREGDFEEEVVAAFGFSEEKADELAAAVYDVIGDDDAGL